MISTGPSPWMPDKRLPGTMLSSFMVLIDALQPPQIDSGDSAEADGRSQVRDEPQSRVLPTECAPIAR